MNLFSAVATNYYHYVINAIKNNDNLNQTDYFKRTPIYYAIAYQSYDMIKLLLSHNIDLLCQDQFELNAYDYAFYYAKKYPMLYDFFSFCETEDYYQKRWDKASSSPQFVVHKSDDDENDESDRNK